MSTMAYCRREISAPHLTGTTLRALAALAESAVSGGLVRRQMFAQAGIDALRGLTLDEPPTPAPRHPFAAAPAAPAVDLVALANAAAGKPAHFETAADLAAAYRSGHATPSQVAERVAEVVDDSERCDPPLRLFIARDQEAVLRQAAASSERFRQGAPLGPLDGVPVAVKDEIDVAGYPTTLGTSFQGSAPAAADATAVARLRAAGAVVIGKTNMHEIGIGVTGVNPHHGAARNPYRLDRVTGGSSSGSAAAVAAGLCPLALGADGGGSIRIPAALCGVVGLKPTFGRVSEHGAAPLCWSVAHLGPIGASARDVALGYALIAGPDGADAGSLQQPPVELDRFDDGDLSSLTVGIFAPWFEDADAAVVEAGRRLLDGLAALGLGRREVEIEDLDLFQLAHLVTIVSEMLESQRPHLAQHRARYGGDVRLNLALAEGLTATDYVRAQRLRTRACRNLLAALANADLLLTPATAGVAPPIHPAALACGESNLTGLNRLMRFAAIGNLTGLPAITFPAGYTVDGLPIGYQLIGRPWSEGLLLRVANAIEKLVERRQPRWHRTLLG
ncbi:MAG: amidase [Deltaproteobacteria bacterium]|nr:amidase [Deltaproteobacteria bacterium]